jgi:exopolysaccharide biosynthesis polyprenyl glycosylphosphotransferase
MLRAEAESLGRNWGEGNVAAADSTGGTATDPSIHASSRATDRQEETAPRGRAWPTIVRRRGWVVRRALLAADVLGLLTAFVATGLLFGSDGAAGDFPFRLELLVFIAALPVWVVGAKLYGLYDHDEKRTDHSTADELVSVFHLVTVGVWLFFALSWLAGLIDPNQKKLTTFWALTIAFLAGSRAIARALIRRHPAFIQRVVVVGAGDVGQLIGRKLRQHPEYGVELVGFIDSDPKEQRADLGDTRVLGGLGELPILVREQDVDRVVVAFARDSHEELLRVIAELRDLNVQVDIVPRLFEAVGAAGGMHSVEGLPLVALPPIRLSRSTRLLKRTLDVVAASAALVMIAPVFAVIALWIKRDSSGPVFFRQTRLGMNMREFTVLKFRTMRQDTDDAPHREYVRTIMDSRAPVGANRIYKLERADSVTRVGRILRRTSLDELPQLLNVLRGDMSLVGPRPCIPYEIEYFEPQHFERFLVPAGVTGLWQVSARARSTFREALDLDVAYARSASLGLDFRILLRTPLMLFRVGGTA